MTRAGLAALLSHWRRRPFQLLTLILGLALATALWTGVQAINAEARASYDAAADTLTGGAYPVLERRDGGPLSIAEFVTMRRAGWLVSPVLEGRAEIGDRTLRLVGIDPLTAPPDLAPQAVTELDDADAVGGEATLIFAAPETAAALAAVEGIDARGVEGIPPDAAFGDIAAIAELLDAPDEITRLVLLPGQPRGRPPLDQVAPELERQTPASGQDLDRLTDSFHLNLTAFGLLSFAVGLFIVNGAIGLAFEQRRAVFRTLRALGMPLATLIRLLLAELLVLALIAGALGVALGYVVAAVLLPDVAATLRGLYGAEVAGTLSVRPVWWAAGLVIAVAGTLVAAAQSLARVARMPILAAAQSRAWARATTRGIVRMAALATGLFAVSLAAGLFGNGLVAGFVMLGALLLAAALALPLYLHGALAIGAWLARRPMAQWFWADTRQQLPGLTLALMALHLALAANIGVGTMVSSFRLTFTGWLDQRLASELYVSARDADEAAQMQDFLAPRTEAILPIWNVEANAAGLPAEIFGVADHATYRDNWPLLDAVPQVWDVVAAGEGVLINEQLARREALGPGDTVTIDGTWEDRVAGIYSDYGNPQGQVLMSIPALTSRFPEVERLNFGLRVAPGETDAVARALREEFGLPADNIVDQQSLKNFSLQVFDRTFTVTGALNVLTLAIAGFAILTSLLTLAAMRLPQLAPVWALGETRRGLARLELVRALMLAALTFVAAVPAGLALAWVLLAVINVEAFGWRLPMHLFPRDWAILGALSLLAAALAALWPAQRLARIPATALLGVFANER